VVAGAEWLVSNGGPAVLLLGVGNDRLPTVRGELAPFQGSAAEAGRPHPASTVEAALEAALARESWATGRRWNQDYRSNALTPPVRLDLLWSAERCVVEIDGPEHCRPDRYELDRRRDVQLTLDGYSVLRFTNARITHDVGAVVHQIGTFVRARRRDTAEGNNHGRR
jgi:very-short-patch-repair endonuclease